MTMVMTLCYMQTSIMEQRGLASVQDSRSASLPHCTAPCEIAACMQAFMEQHGFASIEDFRGATLPYFTTHHELVRLQREAIDAKKRARTGLAGDADWSGDGFVRCATCSILGCQGCRVVTFITTHHELVRLQREAIDAKQRAGLAGDANWSGDGFVRCATCPP